ncbi:hypothetical protein OC25_02005 [Pedobacter kyungheensis]|uniref:HTH asnC-type domain-containing protein n=1 Tax=Pedobacter kyungheensis TaxID=1069985 RepID=A0A0C1FXF4_9SPHI|nr:Lrp/AsnC family transcriptional regulator [Pedobacter kyungheensis]KIA96543.1 hypothetical protein OC25_02005 [Pedobacter kyungheensis]
MESYYPDQTDLAILKLLQKEARLTYNEIGRRLHKSKSPIIERVRRLEKLGYIRGYVALLDYELLRDCMMAYVRVRLNAHSGAALEEFQAAVTAFPEVLECCHTTGEDDFVLKVVTSSLQSYNAFLRQKLDKLPNIGQVSSSMVLAQTKHSTVVPF